MSQSGSGLLPRPGLCLTYRLLVRADRAERSAIGRFPSCLGIYGLGGAALARSALRALTGPLAVLVPVVSVLFPEPGRGLDCPDAGPGKAVRALR